MNKTFKDIMDDLLIKTITLAFPVLRIPGVGDKLEDKIRNSYTVKMLHSAWIMFSLM